MIDALSVSYEHELWCEGPSFSLDGVMLNVEGGDVLET